MSTLLEMRIDELEEKNAALAAQVEALRSAALDAISFMPGGEAKAALRDAYDAIPQHHLRQVRADAGRDGFIEGFRYDDEIHFNGAPSDIKIAADKYHASILAGKE